jgi:hypothetical protein
MPERNGIAWPAEAPAVKRLRSAALPRYQREERAMTRLVTLVTAQCGCGEFPVAAAIDGRKVSPALVCKSGHDVTVLPVYGASTMVVR